MRIYFFENQNKKSPIKKFIDRLPLADQARFFEVIDEIEKYGLSGSRIIFKPIEGKLWEVKFNSATSSYRVLYVMIEKDLMAWLHAFSKKTQKTSKLDLDVARKRMKEILR